MYRRLLLGMAAAIAVLVVAFGGAGSVVRADGGGSISGRIIHDLDGDGDPMDVEPGLSNWRVELREETDEGESDPVETRTDRNGEFNFDGLAPGDYSVSIPCDGQPHLWMATWPSSSTWFGVTVEDGSTPEPIHYLLMTLDEAPETNGSIAGRLTWDENRDALPDPSERGAAGWSLSVSMIEMPQCFSAEDKQVMTAADGSFSVSGLLPGKWSVGTARAPEGEHTSYTLDYPGFSEQYANYEAFYFEALVDVPEAGTGNVAMGILDVGGTGSISGEFYWDQNQDGMKQADEPLVVCQCFFGIMVRTPRGFAPFFDASSSNMNSGAFTFSGLAAGEYLVLASSSSPRFITVADGEHVTGIDFGLSFASDQPPPTVSPNPPSPTPGRISTPQPPTIVGAPVTGGGGASSATAEPFVPGLLGFGSTLLVVGSLYMWGMRRARR